MTAEDGESSAVLVEQRLGRQGLEVKLDRGFEDGGYCVYVEYEVLASRIGFTAARRQAGEFAPAEGPRCRMLRVFTRRG